MTPCDLDRTAWIGLGANLGRRRATLEEALARLDRHSAVRVEARSGWYETAPVGGPAGQPPYLNAVARLATSLEPRALLELCLEIERELGRDRTGEIPNGPRPVDLDLLLCGDQRLADPDLILPHPRLEERAFVLRPLAELAPDLVLPGSGRTVREALSRVLSAGLEIRP